MAWNWRRRSKPFFFHFTCLAFHDWLHRRALDVQIQKLNANKTTVQSVLVEERGVGLMRHILLWFEVQKIYMPCASALRLAVGVRATQDVSESEGPEEDSDAVLTRVPFGSAVDVQLFLPHELSSAARSTLPVDLVNRYIRLREAQAEDALLSMKRSLRRSVILKQHKKDHTTGPGVAANTRMQSSIRASEARTALDAARYRAARDALLKLHTSDGTFPYPVLKESDIRPLHEEPKRPKSGRHANEDPAQPTGGHWEISWIHRFSRKACQQEESDVSIADDGQSLVTILVVVPGPLLSSF